MVGAIDFGASCKKQLEARLGFLERRVNERHFVAASVRIEAEFKQSSEDGFAVGLDRGDPHEVRVVLPLGQEVLTGGEEPLQVALASKGEQIHSRKGTARPGPVHSGRVGRVAAPTSVGEESPDFTGHGARRKPGRGDPTESATETNRLGLPG